MNKKELMEKLEFIPDDAELFISGYEGGYTKLTEVTPVQLEDTGPDHDWYYGRFVQSDQGTIAGIVLSKGLMGMGE